MKGNDFFLDKKSKLMEEGNFFKHHFLDIESKEWNDLDISDFVIEQEKYSADVLTLLQVDKIFKINGITYFIRFKDKLRRQLLEEGIRVDKINAEIKKLHDYPPAWASVFKDEYNKIIEEYKGDESINDIEV